MCLMAHDCRLLAAEVHKAFILSLSFHARLNVHLKIFATPLNNNNHRNLLFENNLSVGSTRAVSAARLVFMK